MEPLEQEPTACLQEVCLVVQTQEKMKLRKKPQRGFSEAYSAKAAETKERMKRKRVLTRVSRLSLLQSRLHQLEGVDIPHCFYV